MILPNGKANNMMQVLFSHPCLFGDQETGTVNSWNVQRQFGFVSCDSSRRKLRVKMKLTSRHSSVESPLIL